MDFKEFFLTDNKSGWKSNSKLLLKNRPEIHEMVVAYVAQHRLEDYVFKDQLFYFVNNITEKVVCLECGKPTKSRGTIAKGFAEYCSNACLNFSANSIRVKKAMQAKYGVNGYSQTPEHEIKVKATKLANFGDENYNNMDKNKATKLERYGNENYVNIEAAKITNLEKYGFDNVSKNEDVIKKIGDTNLLKYGSIAPTQSKGVMDKLKLTMFNKIKSKVLIDEFIDYDFDLKSYTLLCDKCSTEYKMLMPLYNERKRANQSTCTTCNPIGIPMTSSYEIEIYDSIKTYYDGDVVRNDRTILKQELDIYIPEFKLAIEFNGLYWHSEIYKNEKYHLNKQKACLEKGITLIHIFEDEWYYRKSIVESVIKNRLGLIDNKLFGRKCTIQSIDNKTSDSFLDDNHIQGSGSANSIRLGLYHQDELVSVMTFSKGRVAMGGNSDEYELTRFCNKKNTSVIGAASKLFKYFRINNVVKNIISYSDNRWFDGGMYQTLGFTYTHESKENYWYVVGNQRKHRFNFRKDVLVKQGYDSTKTEREIMFERKLYRIYDCGNKRWDFKI